MKEQYFVLPKQDESLSEKRVELSEEGARKLAKAWVRTRNEACFVVKAIALYAPTVVEITNEEL